MEGEQLNVYLKHPVGILFRAGHVHDLSSQIPDFFPDEFISFRRNSYGEIGIVAFFGRKAIEGFLSQIHELLLKVDNNCRLP